MSEENKELEQNEEQNEELEMDLEERVLELEALVTGLIDQMGTLNNAVLAGVGSDPAIAMRTKMKHKPVQFLKKYSRNDLMSKIQKGTVIIPSYSVEAGDIANLREDEIKRITVDFPELLITVKSKFVEKEIYTYGLDEQGKPRKKPLVTKVSVDDLIKVAPTLA